MSEDVSDLELAKRLSQIVDDHSQAKVARAAGVSKNNIHYYLKGRRIPANVCSRLVKELGVNPSWLLVGEGAPYLAEVRASEVTKAVDLNDLVSRMNAVMKLKLGSLAGNDSAKILRDLNATMTLHKDLAEELNERAKPILQDLVEQFREALDAFDVKVGEQLRRSAVQVAEFCHDPDLARDLDRLQATLEYMTHNPHRSLKFLRSLILRVFAGETELNQEVMQLAHYYLSILRATGNLAEAERFSRAMLEYYRHLKHNHEYAGMLFMNGLIFLDFGDVNEASSKLQESLGRMQPENRDNQKHILILCDLFRGALTSDEVLAAYDTHTQTLKVPTRVSYASTLYPFMIFEGDDEKIALATKYYQQDALSHPDVTMKFAAQGASLLLDLIKKPNATKVTEYLKSEVAQNVYDSDKDIDKFAYHVFGATLYRKAEAKDQALRQLRTAEKERPKILSSVKVRLFIFTHYRNALALLKDSDRAQWKIDLLAHAQRELQNFYDAGYGWLGSVVPELRHGAYA